MHSEDKWGERKRSLDTMYVATSVCLTLKYICTNTCRQTMFTVFDISATEIKHYNLNVTKNKVL